jgi:hypothetical protein
MLDEEAECGERSSSRKRGGCGRLNGGLALFQSFDAVSRNRMSTSTFTYLALKDIQGEGNV